MSIDIDWPRLTTGPEGAELAASIRDFIHNKFQQVELPRFIRSVQVHSFDFGDECPRVEIKDFGDPWVEFYEDEEGSTSERDEEEAGKVDGRHGIPEREASERAPLHPSRKPNRPSDASLDGTVPGSRPPYRPSKPYHLDKSLSSHPTNSTFPYPQETPFLSGSNTPGIPGGTSNFSYFHLPLSSGLRSGTPQTPLAAAFGAGSLDQHVRASSPVRTYTRSTQPAYLESIFRPNMGSSDPYGRAVREGQTRDNNREGHEDTDTAIDVEEEGVGDDQRANDLQTTLHITYNGNLSLSLTAEILLDYPMPSFVGIPLALKITGLSFNGVALLAYVRPRSRKGRGQGWRRSNVDDVNKGRCHFCFLGPEDAGVVVGDCKDQVHFQENGKGGSKGLNKQENGGSEGIGALLREIRVETEIGRQENGKQVLKNVGKVEKFVLEQVRRIFEEELVWPSFWTFLV